MAEQMLGQVTVSDSSNRQATGSGARDGNTIDIQLGPQPWIQKGGNYTLTAGGNVWKAMCTGSDASGYFRFQTY